MELVCEVASAAVVVDVYVVVIVRAMLFCFPMQAQLVVTLVVLRVICAQNNLATALVLCACAFFWHRHTTQHAIKSPRPKLRLRMDNRASAMNSQGKLCSPPNERQADAVKRPKEGGGRQI